MVLCRFGQKTTKQVIEQVASNDPKLTSLDLTKNASFCMHSTRNTIALSEALARNTVIKTVVLRECEIVDEGAIAIAKALEQNSTIEELDLQQNRITTAGVVQLVNGIKKNSGLRTLNLLSQAQQNLGEDCVEAFISAFEFNITLTKLMWKVDSRRSWELAKLITRNVEIQKFASVGGDYSHLLPTRLRKDVTAPVADESCTDVLSSLLEASPDVIPEPAAEEELSCEEQPTAEPEPCVPDDTTEVAPKTCPIRTDTPPRRSVDTKADPAEAGAPPLKSPSSKVPRRVLAAFSLPPEEPAAEEVPAAELNWEAEEINKDDVAQPWRMQQKAMQAEVQRLQARVAELEAAGGTAGGTGNAPANTDVGSELIMPESPPGCNKVGPVLLNAC
jgi:hypothetical protein